MSNENTVNPKPNITYMTAVIDKAVKKLNDEMLKANNENFATPIIKHLIKRCNDNFYVSKAVLQAHKKWEECSRYINDKARKQAKDNWCAIPTDVVFAWAEDYYLQNDNKEESKQTSNNVINIDNFQSRYQK